MPACFAVSFYFLLAMKGSVETEVDNHSLAPEPGDDITLCLSIPFENDKALAQLAGVAGSYQGDIIPVGKPMFKCVDKSVQILLVAGNGDALSEISPGVRAVVRRG